MKEKKKQESGALRTVFRVLILLVLLFLVVMIILFKRGIRLGDLFHSRTLAPEAQTELFYENGTVFAGIDGGLAVASTSCVQVIDNNGTSVLSVNVIMSKPVISSGGAAAVAYDAGGNSVLVMKANGLLYKLTSDQTVISASVNDDGWLALCTEDSGYDGRVTVYDASGSEVYKWYSGSGYIVSAAVSPNDKNLAAASVATTGSSVAFMSLSSTDETAKYEADNSVALEIAYRDNETAGLLTSDSYLLLDTKTGKSKADTAASGAYLQGYSFASDKFAVIASSPYQKGTGAMIDAIGSDGTVAAEINFGKTINGVSAAGNYVAVLSSGDITVYKVYNKETSVYAEYQDSSAEAVVAYSDGSVLAVGAYSARTYSP